MKIYFCYQDSAAHAAALQKELPNDEIFCCAPAKLTEIAPQADVILPLATKITAEVFEHSNLKLIQQFGAGINSIDLNAAKKHGVPVANVPTTATGNAISVAELTIFFMLGLARRYPEATDFFTAKKLYGPLGDALYKKTAIIVGYGGLGQTIAARLKAFTMNVIAVSKTAKTKSSIPIDSLEPITKLATLTKQADFLIIALPLTAETTGLINKDIFATMKATSFLVNVGRGPTIDYQSLIAALKNRQIAGAALDVFWQEPFHPDDPLFDYNVIATPHIGAATNFNLQTIVKKVAANINLVREGEPPLYSL